MRMTKRLNRIAVYAIWLGIAFPLVGVSSLVISSQPHDHGLSACNVNGGMEVFSKCVACHSVEPGKHIVGPSLHGVVGRTAGHVQGFRASKALRKSEIKWDDQTLDQFLLNPQKAIPRTIMAFSGLKSEEERSALICYLNSLK